MQIKFTIYFIEETNKLITNHTLIALVRRFKWICKNQLNTQQQQQQQQQISNAIKQANVHINT